MKKMIIFEPAMCCPTGICGPSVDPELLRVSTLMNNLKIRGTSVERYNLTNDPQKFVDFNNVNELLSNEGMKVLPITMLDGLIVKTGGYPTNEEVCEFLDIPKDFLRKPIKLKTKGCGCKGGCC